jgi:hypothetical protein
MTSRPLRAVVMLTLLAVPALLLAEDVLERYDFDRVQAENSVLGAVRGWWDPPDVPDLVRALPPEERAAAVVELGGFVKAYVQSAEFQKNYAKAWKDAQPKRGFGLPKLDVKTATDKAAEMAAGDKKSAKPTGLDKDPKVTVRRRLQQFLDETADIDYAAATVGEGAARRFSDPAYEAKPALWKMGFRAGRETTEAARAFAKEWMEELPAR